MAEITTKTQLGRDRPNRSKSRIVRNYMSEDRCKGDIDSDSDAPGAWEKSPPRVVTDLYDYA